MMQDVFHRHDGHLIKRTASNDKFTSLCVLDETEHNNNYMKGLESEQSKSLLLGLLGPSLSPSVPCDII